MNALLIEGIKYYLWTPEKEEELHSIVKEHSNEIFGQHSLYLPIEQMLISEAGRGAMPDGFAIVFSEKPEIYVVEVELSSHDLDKHIVEQITRFFRVLKNPDNRKKLADDLDREIRRNPLYEGFVRKEIGSREIYRFISDLVEQPPKIAIIIESRDAKLRETFDDNWKVTPIICELKTYRREDEFPVHAHLFEPIFEKEIQLPAISQKHIVPNNLPNNATGTKKGDAIEIELTSMRFRKYALFNLNQNTRSFFPGFKVNFVLETDIGEIETRVTAGNKDTKLGDPKAGAYINGGLRPWYNKHPEATIGRKLRFECIEPNRRYQLILL